MPSNTRYPLRFALNMLIAVSTISGCQQKKSESKAPPQTTQGLPIQPQSANQKTVRQISNKLAFPKRFVKVQWSKSYAEFKEVGGASQYLSFDKYGVMTTPQTDAAGDRIDVIRRKRIEGDTLTVTSKDSVIFSVGEMGTRFGGLVDDYLFIDNSTGPGPIGLDVYNLITGTHVFSDFISDDDSEQDGYFLTCWTRSDSVATRENCPQFQEWEAQGFGAAFEEKVTIDIRSGTKKRLGKFRCVPTQ